MSVISKVFRQSITQRLADSDAGISHLQYGLLHMLTHESGTISELSRKFTLDPSTLVPVVDSLERKGLVKRERDPNDRRRIPITLTDAGLELVRSVPMMSDDDALLTGLRDMGEESAQQLLDLLHELVRQLPEGEEILENVRFRISIRHGKDDNR